MNNLTKIFVCLCLSLLWKLTAMVMLEFILFRIFSVYLSLAASPVSENPHRTFVRSLHKKDNALKPLLAITLQTHWALICWGKPVCDLWPCTKSSDICWDTSAGPTASCWKLQQGRWRKEGGTVFSKLLSYRKQFIHRSDRHTPFILSRWQQRGMRNTGQPASQAALLHSASKHRQEEQGLPLLPWYQAKGQETASSGYVLL